MNTCFNVKHCFEILILTTAFRMSVYLAMFVSSAPSSKKPKINYNLINENHFCYDLIYNPEKTSFLKECEKKGARIMNGLEMLKSQAEESWIIWNSVS